MARRRNCRNCGCGPVRANGRCHPCDTYRKRTGRERPEELIVAHGRRIIEAELDRRAA